MQIGTGGITALTGYMRRLRYWPKFISGRTIQSMTAIGLSDDLVVDLDFTTAAAQTTSLLTFTRATQVTYFDVNGTMQVAASGVPRYDYDLITHAAKGYLSEEARTNYFLNSDTGLST